MGIHGIRDEILRVVHKAGILEDTSVQHYQDDSAETSLEEDLALIRRLKPEFSQFKFRFIFQEDPIRQAKKRPAGLIRSVLYIRQ